MAVVEPRPDTQPLPQANQRSNPLRPWVWGLWTLVLLGAAVPYAWKAADSRSAFVRWRFQVLEIQDGVNIWQRYYFPNPPILPIMLFPLMALPAVVGALAWYVLKFGMVSWSLSALVAMARPRKGPPLEALGVGLIMLLGLRPILSDLQHGNINLYILFLVVGSLVLWRRGKDTLAGLTLALAIATKVTPALLLVYFLYKRCWKLALACGVGLVLFLLVIPSVVLGPENNWQYLMSWKQNIISPFVQGKVILSTQEVNQSLPGVLTRLLTQTRSPQDHGNNGTELDLNLMSLDPERVAMLGKGLAIALVLMLGWLCRAKNQDRENPRWIGEFALVVLTMLFVSERSWKHHFVTLLLPLTFLVSRLFDEHVKRSHRWLIGSCLALYALLMATTSDDLGRHFAGGAGHEIALYFGFYLWSSVVLYLLAAWRVVAERRADYPALAHEPTLPAPHLPAGRSAAPIEPPPHASPAAKS